MRTILALFAVCIILTGCCGFMPDGADYRDMATDSETGENGVEKRSSHTGFPGKYEIVNEDDAEFYLTISKEGDYYLLEWGEEATEPWYTYGVVVGDYLGSYIMEDEDVMLGIYKRSGDGISGIWDVYGEFLYDMTADAEELELSSYDFSGTYLMESPDPETDEIHYYDLVIEKAGDLYAVTEVFEGGYELIGSGLAVDDVIVMAFPVGGTAVAKMYRLRGSRLSGKHFYDYYDDETGLTEFVVSEEKGKKN